MPKNDTYHTVWDLLNREFQCDDDTYKGVSKDIWNLFLADGWTPPKNFVSEPFVIPVTAWNSLAGFFKANFNLQTTDAERVANIVLGILGSEGWDPSPIDVKSTRSMLKFDPAKFEMCSVHERYDIECLTCLVHTVNLLMTKVNNFEVDSEPDVEVPPEEHVYRSVWARNGVLLEASGARHIREYEVVYAIGIYGNGGTTNGSFSGEGKIVEWRIKPTTAPAYFKEVTYYD